MIDDPLYIRFRRFVDGKPAGPSATLRAPAENLAAIMLVVNDHFGSSWQDIGGPELTPVDKPVEKPAAKKRLTGAPARAKVRRSVK